MVASPSPVRFRIKGTKVYVEAFTPSAGDYTAAGQGRRAKTWRVTSSGPNAALAYAAPVLRARARDQVRNNPYADSAIGVIEANVVGTGIKPQFATPDRGLNRELAQLFADWTDEADADGIADWYGVQALAMRGLAEGGEIFGRLRVRFPDDMKTVPLQVQLLESEFVPHDPFLAATGRDVTAGIEFDARGRRMAYWMYRSHPGDGLGLSKNDDGQPHPVPAAEVIHLYWARRPGAIRGEPWLARALVKLRELDLYDDAELMRKQMAAMFAGFVTKDEPWGEEGFMGEGDPNSAVALAPLEPGTLQVLEPGEDIKFSEPSDVGGSYEAFLRAQHRAVAISAGIMYEQLTGDYSKVNDRTFRASVNEFRRRAEMWQHHLMAYQLCRPTIERWLALAELSGLVERPTGMSDRDFMRVRWVPQGWSYINPVQEVQAAQAAVRAGFRSRAQVVSETGHDVEEIEREIADDNARADARGLAFDSDGRKGNGSSAMQDQKPDDAASDDADREQDESVNEDDNA